MRDVHAIHHGFNRRNTKKQQGFTLIELLIALAISAIISALAYQAINGVVNVQTNVQAHSQRMAEVQRTVWWMEQDLVQLVPRGVQDGFGSTLSAYEYRADLGLELTRIAELPTPRASGGLLRVGYQLRDETLYRLTWPVIDRAPDTKPRRVAILTGVKRFELRFLNDKNRWVTSWPLEVDVRSVPSIGGGENSAPQKMPLPKITEVLLELDDLGVLKRLFMGVS
ncbi:MAG: type II secretion system minor pseudopilin GspJ [Thiomicrorhabdus sp.]|nr:type II secretion system minor pseudopilin GspJ [Thiomicrorhabdus sp.]